MGHIICAALVGGFTGEEGTTNAIDPFWIVERLIDVWGEITVGALHVQIVGTTRIQ